jgi:hypothetical protein
MSAPNGKSSDAANAEALQENITTTDFMRLHAKRKATATAQLAMHGHEVHDWPSGAFLITRWGLSKYVKDLTALEDFVAQVLGARQIGGQQTRPEEQS